MAHFFSSIWSKGTCHTKCGNKDGMSAHIRGWNTGVEVSLNHNKETGVDTVVVRRTGGSNGQPCEFKSMTWTDGEKSP